MTAQAGERLMFEGSEHALAATPLQDYFRLLTLQPDLFQRPPEFSALSSGCWRGYIGSWEIRDGRLYLADIDGALDAGRYSAAPDAVGLRAPRSAKPAGPSAGRAAGGMVLGGFTRFASSYPKRPCALDDVFPGTVGPVFAHWYCGTLRLPQGEVLYYVHGGFGSIYERDLLLEIDHGVLTGVRMRKNSPARAAALQRDKERARREWATAMSSRSSRAQAAAMRAIRARAAIAGGSQRAQAERPDHQPTARLKARWFEVPADSLSEPLALSAVEARETITVCEDGGPARPFGALHAGWARLRNQLDAGAMLREFRGRLIETESDAGDGLAGEAHPIESNYLSGPEIGRGYVADCGSGPRVFLASLRWLGTEGACE